jgi:hypothetical protein
MKKFLPWLIPIVVLLIAIPVLLMVNVTVVAKIAGVVMVVLTTVAIRFWLYAANKYRTRRGKVKFTINERYFLNESFPIYKDFPSREKNALEERAGILLAELSFDRFDRKEVGKDECLAFVMVLALLVSDLPYNDCRQKIVVFKEEGEPEIQFQEGNPVLFIAESRLKDFLLTVRSANMKSLLSLELAEMLVYFYTWQRADGIS